MSDSADDVQKVENVGTNIVPIRVKMCGTNFPTRFREYCSAQHCHTLDWIFNKIERKNAPVAQMDRVLPSEGRGREFESRQARQFNQ